MSAAALPHRSPRPTRCSNEECHSRADHFLADLNGSVPLALCWDPIHQLQGHAHLGDHELVVIAPRDDAHQTVVVTAEDWDDIRRASADRRHRLLQHCAIKDRRDLVALLAG